MDDKTEKTKRTARDLNGHENRWLCLHYPYNPTEVCARVLRITPDQCRQQAHRLGVKKIVRTYTRRCHD